MVRLKEAFKDGAASWKFLFQFQYGSIKSNELKSKEKEVVKFQFQYGSIKSLPN